MANPFLHRPTNRKKVDPIHPLPSRPPQKKPQCPLKSSARPLKSSQFSPCKIGVIYFYPKSQRKSNGLLFLTICLEGKKSARLIPLTKRKKKEKTWGDCCGLLAGFCVFSHTRVSTRRFSTRWFHIDTQQYHLLDWKTQESQKIIARTFKNKRNQSSVVSKYTCKNCANCISSYKVLSHNVAYFLSSCFL